MIKIFIAHSDPKLVALHQQKLKAHFSVDSASDGLMALRKIKVYKPHVILSAFDLPLLSGLGLLKFVRSHPQLCTHPFILFGKTEDLALALSLGASDWLSPHISTDLVLERIYYHLRLNKHFILNF